MNLDHRNVSFMLVLFIKELGVVEGNFKMQQNLESCRPYERDVSGRKGGSGNVGISVQGCKMGCVQRTSQSY